MISSPESTPPVRLNSWLNPQLLARIYGSAGRVHIPDFFEPATAKEIHACLVDRTPWQLALNDGAADVDLPAVSFASMPDAERIAWLAATDRAAARGFSYRYSNFRIYENYRSGSYGDLYLMRVLEFLNSHPFRDLMRQVCGDDAIEYADAQATLYRPGDFLTQHNDLVDGKNRRAAYVLNFTSGWRVDWGGLLAFPDDHGHVAEAYAPKFNALNLFRVPMLHCVTQVSSFAAVGRYSITGWLRQGPVEA